MRTIDDLQAIADHHGWMINPDSKVVKTVLSGQNKAKVERGDYYCPCKLQKTAENVCPCKNAGNEIAAHGKCYCNLYYALPKK